MRTYNDKLQLELVVCNQCKKRLKVENGILKEGCFHAENVFDYFSEKDGEKHWFDLCEKCYDRLIENFSVPVEIQEISELL